jgi:hypothetical protein
MLTPITLREANAFVAQHHRHHDPARGCIVCVAVAERRDVGGPRPGDAGYGMHMDVIAGVAIVGRPVARMLDDGWTAEVLRCCTDGTPNACPMLYGAAWRAARAVGYRRLVTYTLPEEGGTSLRAAGWRLIGQAGGGSWNRTERPRVDTHPLQAKLRWEVAAA